MGGSRQSCTASFPPDRYVCLLDELPLHLLPRATRKLLEQTADRPLVLNPECRLRRGDDLPDQFRARQDLLSGFALQGKIAWVRDPEDGTLLPFWLSGRLEALLRELSPNQRIHSSIPAPTISLLAQAGILVPEQTSLRGSRRRSWKNLAAGFQEKSYAPLSSLIHPFHVAALRRYYRYQVRTGAIHLGDRQSARRYTAHNEPVARFFHHQLASTLSQVAGEALKPSYVYLASYLSGAELKKHTDREQCDYSITVCVDYSPEPDLATPWPIRLQTAEGTVSVYQGLGDGLAYRGTRVPHYRDKLGEGQTSTSIFFHYVREDFAGSLD